MALNVQVGTLVQPGATGNQTTNLPADFDPKALIVWATPLTADATTNNVDAVFGMGMATYRGSAVQHGYVSYFSDNASGSAATACGIDTTSLLRLFSAVTPTVDCEIDFVSFATGASSAFTVNWVNLHTTASIRVHYMVLGGSDITDALVHNYALSTFVATQDVTVATGFGQPDLILSMSSGQTSLADARTSPAIQFGAAKSATERFSASFNDEDAGTAMLCASWNRERFLATITPTTQAAEAEADLSAKASWPTDGFQLSYPIPAGLTTQIISLALKGTFTSKVTFTDSPTATGNVDTDHGSVPKGALMFSAAGPGNSTSIATNTATLGAILVGALDGTNEAFAGAGNDDGALTSDCTSANSTAKVLNLWTASTGAVVASADGSISGNSARLGWTTVDSVAHRFGILTLGSATAASGVSAAGGIASAEAFGASSVRRKELPAAVASAEAFGVVTVGDVAVSVTGVGAIATEQTFGTPGIRRAEATVGLASAEAHGTQGLRRLEQPTGIAGQEVAGTSTARRVLGPAGVASAEQAGTPRITTVTTQGVPSAEAHGTPGLTRLEHPAGVGTAEATGTPGQQRNVGPAATASQEAAGTPAGQRRVGTAAIATGEAVGAPAAVRLVLEAGVASAEAHGRPSVSSVLTLTGVGNTASGEAHGTAGARRVEGPAGIGSAEAVGTPRLAVVRAQGIPTAEAVGAPGVVRRETTVGVATGEAHGTAQAARELNVAAIPSDEAFGVTAGRRVVGTAGVASAETAGQPTLTQASAAVTGVGAIPTGEAVGVAGVARLEQTVGIVGLAAVGQPGIVLVVDPAAIPSGEQAGAPQAARVLQAAGVITAEQAGQTVARRVIGTVAVASGETFGNATVGAYVPPGPATAGQVTVADRTLAVTLIADSPVYVLTIADVPLAVVRIADTGLAAVAVADRPLVAVGISDTPGG